MIVAAFFVVLLLAILGLSLICLSSRSMFLPPPTIEAKRLELPVDKRQSLRRKKVGNFFVFYWH